MKTIKYISTFILAGLVLFTSCDKVLDIEPKMDLSDKTALSTTFGLQAAIIGAYDRLQGGDLYGGRLWVAGDMIAGTVKISGEQNTVYEELQMLNKTMSADNRITTSLWQNAYFTINLVNSVIAEIPNVSDTEIEEAKDRLEGEALFIRAMLHFDLLRYIGNPNTGEGIPYLKEPSGIDYQPARDDIETCYQNIITDLRRAMTLLPASNNDRATSIAAEALLARVLFYHGDYADAAQACTNVIDNFSGNLEEQIINNYSSTKSSEMIFGLMSTETDGSAGTLNGYYRFKSSAKFSPSNDFIQLLASETGAGDNRVKQLYANFEGKFFTIKFDDRYMHVPLIRLSEMYLTRAECRIMIDPDDNDGGALADLTVIRDRAGLPKLPRVNSTFILIQRIKELSFEGDYLHNMKRLKRDINIGTESIPWNDIRLIYKIPQRELDVNPNLTQNE